MTIVLQFTVTAIFIPLSLFGQISDEELIRKESAQFSSNYVAGSFEAMMNQYTETAVLMPPARDAISGHGAILDFWKQTTKPVMHRAEPVRIVVEGNLAHDFGYFFVQSQKPGEQPGPVSSAKYYILWTKGADGIWKMKMDMWNSRRTDWNK
jgi:ketosteroid isomerase-like protein